jgi:large subunit ribosomal protein L6
VSRVGKLPIPLPDKVKCEIKDQTVTVTGPKGTLTQEIRPEVDVTVEDNAIVVRRSSDKPEHRAFHGMTRALLNNLVVGVTTGYERELTIVGVGYRAAMQGQSLNLSLGYSHPLTVDPPEGISFAMEGNTVIKVSGIDKQVVGQVAAKIRALRKPEPYKGKGVKYTDEVIRRKVGKAAGK